MERRARLPRWDWLIRKGRAAAVGQSSAAGIGLGLCVGVGGSDRVGREYEVVVDGGGMAKAVGERETFGKALLNYH